MSVVVLKCKKPFVRLTYVKSSLSDFSFQRFIIILTDHLARCESESIDYQTPWYKWVIERLQEVFLLVSTIVYKCIYVMNNVEIKCYNNISIFTQLASEAETIWISIHILKGNPCNLMYNVCYWWCRLEIVNKTT